MTDQRNLILAIVLSVGIILAFQYLYEIPRIEEQQQRQTEQQREDEDSGTITPAPSGEAGTGGEARSGVGVGDATRGGASGLARAEILEQSPRIAIDNGRLTGSLTLEGGRLDDLTLADYRVDIDPESPEINLLNPAGSRNPYFAEFGWVPLDQGVEVPDSSSVWETSATRLTEHEPVELRWSNGDGLTFHKTIELDENYMFTVTRSVVNETGEPVTLHPYSLVSRWGTPETMGFFILHEGPIAVFDGTLNEIDYGDLQSEGVEATTTGGWMGFTDKYWLTALIPGQDTEVEANFRHVERGGENRYQSDMLGPARQVPPGERASVTERFFAGAKEVDKLDAYSAEYGIPLFDRAVDFGWFYFLTKPIFHLLSFFHSLVGNYGVAILLLTLAVKILFFPLANKSYRAMSQMKKLQPEMMKLRERYENDKQKMQQELMALYKREKVNPVSGCLPIVVQIPVFFALYKVLFVSIEMRHAPFFGWIKDLSAPDPTTIFNLFGLLPFDPPSFLMIGIWPLLMGLTMFLQQKLNPQPADPMQARIMMFLPLMFIFIFATFPAGLVIYWTWNNILSIAQQWIIMKRMGVSAS